MAFTDTGMGAGAGKIYDTNESKRLMEMANAFNTLSDKADNTDNNRRDIVRYAIIGAGAILILVGLRFLVKRKK